MIQQKLTDSNLEQWFTTSLGRYVLAREQQLLIEILPKFFGYHLLYVGVNETESIVKSSKIFHKIILTDEVGNRKTEEGYSYLPASPSFLPFREDSVDVIILGHALDFCENTHQLLREAHRVLTPKGKIIIIGFNPFSMWGLPRLICINKAPYNGNFISAHRIKDWLQLLGFDPWQFKNQIFIPPFLSEKLLQKMQKLEQWGEKWWQFAGAVYMIVAVKEICPLTPVKPIWSPKKELITPKLINTMKEHNGV